MKKILIMGGATQDIFMYLQHDEFITKTDHAISYLMFEEGSKISVETLHFASGGGATNVAAALQRLECEPLPLFKVGNDNAGVFIKEELQQRSISTDFVITTSDAITGTSCIIPSPSGNRIIFAYRGAGATLTKDDIEWNHMPALAGFYCTPLAGESAYLLPHILHEAHKNSSSLVCAVNPGKRQLQGDITSLLEALPYIHIFILNEEEAKILFLTLKKRELGLTEEFTIETYCKIMVNLGPKIVIVTCGPRGVYAATHEKIYYHEALHTHAHNSVGAGDAFGSTFFAALLHGYHIETALKYGVINSSSVVASADAKSGLLSLEEIKNIVIKSNR